MTFSAGRKQQLRGRRVFTVVVALVCGACTRSAPRAGRAPPDCRQAAPTPQDGPTAGMKLVPAGSFWRGCKDSASVRCEADELPLRCLSLAAFEIDTTEVTQRAWANCVAAGACSGVPALNPDCAYAPASTPDLPMACVTWTDAGTFCRWAGKRLPTEAEWEKAARGTDGRVYPWGNEPPDCSRANVMGCGQGLKAVGGSSGTSPYGVKDMAGNVWEWVADAYDPGYYAHAPDWDPPGPALGLPGTRIGRGGGFERLQGHDVASFVRASFRHGIQPDTARIGIGFRCAKSVNGSD